MTDRVYIGATPLVNYQPNIFMRTQSLKTLMALCFSLVLFGAFDRASAQCTPPSITTQPLDRTVNPGATFNLGVTAAGTSPFTYQWFQDGNPIPLATGRTYNKTGAQPSDSGIYFVAVSNACGFVYSTNVLVTVTAPPYTLVPLTNHAWRYNQTGADLGTA